MKVVPPGSIGPWRRRLRRLSAWGFLFSVSALIVSVLFARATSDPRANRFREGVEHARAERVTDARDAFREIANSDDKVLACLAYHNLGILALREASQTDEARRLSLAAEAVEMAEASLTLKPGRIDTGRALELALRWSAENRPSEPSGQEQSRREDADTREDGAPSRADRSSGPGEAPDGLTQEAALRLLASFRLLESEGTGSLIQRVLGSVGNRDPSGRRGPPW